MDWRALVKAIAPTIGTALGGPVGGIAARAVSSALLGKEDASEEELSTAVMGASPDQLLALKQADQDFSVKMKSLGIDLEKIAAGDRADARSREITLKDKTPKVLASVIVGGFFGVLAVMIFVDIPAGAQQPVNILLGALTAMLTQVGNYYFGSSVGSARKTELLGK
jgi:uncharacterized membrane protein YeaQ/YmgE (transglycosylase-associated protein family)